MKLELTAEEDAALLGLARELVQADAQFSAEERGEIALLEEDMGKARFDAAIEAASAFASRAELKAHAKTITRPEARSIIYSRLQRIAESDGVDEAQQRPLAWLASWWELGEHAR